MECGVLDNPLNGTVTLPMERIFNSQASYTCNEGFILTGIDNRTCQSDGVWSGIAPTCVEGKQLYRILI